MKKEDLRIGNFVEYNGEIYPVNSIHGDDTIRLFDSKINDSFGCFSLNHKFLKPIKLTDDLLINLGFKREIISFGFKKNITNEQENVYVFTKKIKCKYENFFKNVKIQYLNENKCYHIDSFNINFKYAHELQNIYYEITGEILRASNHSVLLIKKTD